MLDFLKSKKNKSNQTTLPETTDSKGWFKKLRGSLTRTRSNLVDGLSRILVGKKSIDAALFAELETLLLTADVGVNTTQKILADLTQQVERKSLSDPEALSQQLRQLLVDILEPCAQALEINDQPFTVLMVGINGSGKTTSIAKLAHFFQQQDKKVMLAAGDTFRAAAIEQLKVWGERNNVPVIAQHTGADSASVIYDGLAAANSRKMDILIADTAGRLHTQVHLMEELAKIKRVMSKINPKAPHETLLVLDAGIGQNAIAQAKQFNETIGITGIILTKLDGTAKGGVIFAIADQLKQPIRFIGIGEGIDDLKPFDAKEFVDALFA